MAVGTALVLIFAIWLLITFPGTILRLVGGLIAMVAIGIALIFVYEERDRPRREREAAERKAREQATLAGIQREEAALIRDRETYQSAHRWIGVAVDTKHCRYYVDLETMTLGSNNVNVWIKVEKPVIDADLYLHDMCYDYSGPRQVSFNCTGQYVGGAWSFAPGMISETVLRWIQASPWCAKVIADAKAAAERREKARAEAQAKYERQRPIRQRPMGGIRLERDRDGILHFR